MPYYSIAMDFSNAEFYILLADKNSGKILLSENISVKGKDSAKIAHYTLEAIKRLEISVNEISEWTIGSGPGSFTGLRLLTSLVKGLTFGDDKLKTRTIPSAFSFVDTTLLSPNDKFVVLHDGRRDEVIVFNGKMDESNTLSKEYSITILKYDQLLDKGRLDDINFIFTPNKIKDILPESITDELNDKIKVVNSQDLTHLVFSNNKEFDNDLNDLIYVRPAVFVEPRKVRNL